MLVQGERTLSKGSLLRSISESTRRTPLAVRRRKAFQTTMAGMHLGEVSLNFPPFIFNCPIFNNGRDDADIDHIPIDHHTEPRPLTSSFPSVNGTSVSDISELGYSGKTSLGACNLNRSPPNDWWHSTVAAYQSGGDAECWSTPLLVRGDRRSRLKLPVAWLYPASHYETWPDHPTGQLILRECRFIWIAQRWRSSHGTGLN